VESLNIENFFVVADQNQQITEENSSHDELKDVLGLDSSDVIELKENWRNTTVIAAFANYFYTDKASPKPALPNKPSVYTPILYEYEMLNSAKEIILSSYDQDPSKLIGLIVANDLVIVDSLESINNNKHLIKFNALHRFIIENNDPSLVEVNVNTIFLV
jgi:DNA helicase IV